MGWGISFFLILSSFAQSGPSYPDSAPGTGGIQVSEGCTPQAQAESILYFQRMLNDGKKDLLDVLCSQDPLMNAAKGVIAPELTRLTNPGPNPQRQPGAVGLSLGELDAMMGRLQGQVAAATSVCQGGAPPAAVPGQPSSGAPTFSIPGLPLPIPNLGGVLPMLGSLGPAACAVAGGLRPDLMEKVQHAQATLPQVRSLIASTVKLAGGLPLGPGGSIQPLQTEQAIWNGTRVSLQPDCARGTLSSTLVTPPLAGLGGSHVVGPLGL